MDFPWELNDLKEIKYLQATERQATKLLESPDGKTYVKKEFYQKSRGAEIESAFLLKNSPKDFEYLVLPRILKEGSDFFVLVLLTLI